MARGQRQRRPCERDASSQPPARHPPPTPRHARVLVPRSRARARRGADLDVPAQDGGLTPTNAGAAGPSAGSVVPPVRPGLRQPDPSERHGGRPPPRLPGVRNPRSAAQRRGLRSLRARLRRTAPRRCGAAGLPRLLSRGRRRRPPAVGPGGGAPRRSAAARRRPRPGTRRRRRLRPRRSGRAIASASAAGGLPSISSAATS